MTLVGVVSLLLIILRHFLTNIRRVSNPAFLPEDQDILQVRVKTTGVIEYNFKNKDDREFIMVRAFLGPNSNSSSSCDESVCLSVNNKL